jgi:hypothetical protein
MLQKNIDKQKRKERRTWSGYKPLHTPTKKEKLARLDKKYKNKREEM